MDGVTMCERGDACGPRGSGDDADERVADAGDEEL